jgi:DNA (cytosine-5)-methyltransferase 1
LNRDSGFSVAGRKEGFNDPCGRLFFEIIRLLREFGNERPKILMLENVKHLLLHDKGKTFARIKSELQSVDYPDRSDYFQTCQANLLA